MCGEGDTIILILSLLSLCTKSASCMITDTNKIMSCMNAGIICNGAIFMFISSKLVHITLLTVAIIEGLYVVPY